MSGKHLDNNVQDPRCLGKAVADEEDEGGDYDAEGSDEGG